MKTPTQIASEAARGWFSETRDGIQAKILTAQLTDVIQAAIEEATVSLREPCPNCGVIRAAQAGEGHTITEIQATEGGARKESE